MPRDLIDPDDGENRAVRAFLMHYGAPGLTVGQMKENMRRAGWLMCWPTWAQTANPDEHLTKAGAQNWLRHLFALEGKDGVKACARVERHCQNGRADICRASQRDGVVCPANSCDIDDGVRPPDGVTGSDDQTVSRHTPMPPGT